MFEGITPERNEKTPGTLEKPLVETGLEHLIESSYYIGQGKDAVVFRLSTESVSADEEGLLKSEGILPEDDTGSLATKILKVYSPGTAREEMAFQEKARMALETARDQEVSVCTVPKAFVATDQHINEETEGFLNRHGANLKERVEFVVMDYVDGKDFGTVMYDFVLAETGIDEETLAAMSYEEKEQQVGVQIGFEIPSGHGATPEEIESERSIVFARNEQKLITYLRRHNFRMDPKIIDTIERSLHILHKSGIYHNDIHKRNVMIGYDGTPYIIDFGRSGKTSEEGGLDDLAALRMWRPLTKTFDEDMQEKKQQAFRDISQIAGRMMQQPKYTEKIEKLKEEVQNEGLTALTRELGRARVSDTLLERFFIQLKSLGSDDETRDVLLQLLKEMDTPRMQWRPAELNMIKRFNDSGFWVS